MLLGPRGLPMVSQLATLAGWPLLPRQQPGRPQPTVSPSCGTDAGSRGDRRRDGLPVVLTVAELLDSNRKG